MQKHVHNKSRVQTEAIFGIEHKDLKTSADTDSGDVTCSCGLSLAAESCWVCSCCSPVDGDDERVSVILPMGVLE